MQDTSVMLHSFNIKQISKKKWEHPSLIGKDFNKQTLYNDTPLLLTIHSNVITDLVSWVILLLAL